MAKQDLSELNQHDLDTMYNFYHIPVAWSSSPLSKQDRIWLLAYTIHHGGDNIGGIHLIARMDASELEILSQAPVLEALFRAADIHTIQNLCKTNKDLAKACREPLYWETIVDRFIAIENQIRGLMNTEPKLLKRLIDAAIEAKDSKIAEAFLIGIANKNALPEQPVVFIKTIILKTEYAKLLDILLKKVNDAKINSQPFKNNLLRMTITNNKTDMTKLLLKNDTDPNFLDIRKRTPLMFAGMTGNTAIIPTLLQAGAKIDAIDDIGYTALMHAIESNKPDAALVLLNNGADARIANKTNETTLLVASLNPTSNEVYKRLLQSVDPNIANNGGQTPLRVAIENKFFNKAQLLLDHGADPNLQNKIGQTPLMYATDNISLAKLLLKHGAKPNIQDRLGNTALIEIVISMQISGFKFKERTQIAKLLLEYGADVNIRNNNGFSVCDAKNVPKVAQMFASLGICK